MYCNGQRAGLHGVLSAVVPDVGAAEELVVATKVPCGVCFENLDTCYGEIPGVGGYSCRSCNWYVCNRCWSEGNDARWNPQTDEPSEQV